MLRETILRYRDIFDAKGHARYNSSQATQFAELVHAEDLHQRSICVQDDIADATDRPNAPVWAGHTIKANP